MKKNLFLLMMLLPLCVWADEFPTFSGARITSITDNEGGFVKFTYDNQGRIISEHGKTYYGETTTTYTYGSGLLTINSLGNADGETLNEQFSLHISNGRIESYKGIEDGYPYTSNYTYDGENRLISNSIVFTGVDNVTRELTWNGNLLTKIVDKEGVMYETTGIVSYTNEMADKMALAFFFPGNFLFDWPDFLQLLTVPTCCMGILPDRLVSKIEITDIEEGREYHRVISFKYKRDSNNFITEVEVSSGGDTTVYYLTWEGTSEVPSVPPTPAEESFVIGDLKYTKLDDATVSVSAANTGITGEIQIPSMVRNDGKSYNVTTVAEGGFEGCSRITSVTLMATIKAIGDRAFANCSGLNSLTLNASEPIAISESVFAGVDKQKCKLNVPSGSGNKYREAPVWRNFWCVAGADENIEGGITYKVNAGGSVTIVSANHSPSGRYKVPSTVVINGVEYTVTAIGPNAFKDCTGLTAVTIPETITEMADYAFAGCSNLAELYALGSNPIDLTKALARGLLARANGSSVTQFEGIDFENCVLYVPKGSEALYRNAEGWKQFVHIVGVETAGINGLSTDDELFDVYTIQGRKVLSKSASLEGLPKGIYLRNGKKVIVRGL